MRIRHKTLFSALAKTPESRTEFECQEIVPWFRNKSVLFNSLKPEIVADVIRHCDFERKVRNDVLIKQGENGDKLYIILRGSVSIYVIHDQSDNPQDTLKQVESVCSAPDFDRTQLGQYVWSGGEGKSFGEVALLKEDCIRTATVVADTDTDLVVIDRDLYNRSVRDVLEREYKLKTKFVEENSLFKQWPAKPKKMLVVALKKESAKYGTYMIRQGSPTEHLIFLLSGEMEITCDQSQFKSQYEDLWREMETLLPGLLPRRRGHQESPHERMKRKKAQHKLVQMCLLGANEVVGSFDVVLRLPTCLDNAMVTRESEVLLLSRENYERLFNRKYAHDTVRKLKERMKMRLYLYINRAEMLHSSLKSPFLKFLSFLLDDDNAVEDLKRMKRREREEKRGLLHETSHPRDDLKYGSKEAKEMNSMLKLLDINPKSTQGRLPAMESSERIIKEIEDGLKSWVERSRGSSPNSAIMLEPPKTAIGQKRRTTSFHGAKDLLRPDYHTRSLTRPKTPTE
ncbi:hypothetical protein ACF0H5_020781 [Mactra antiquata]